MDGRTTQPVAPTAVADLSITTGEWATETASADALDHRLLASGLFRIYSEVRGVLMQPRPGQIDRAVRIDRLLVPTERLYEHGWHHGVIGVEIKRSGVRIGPPLAQAMDYVRSSWAIRGVWMQLGGVFVWPMDKQYGPLASVMINQRVGSASFSSWSQLHLRFGEQTVLRVDRDGLVTVGYQSVDSGRKVGSR